MYSSHLTIMVKPEEKSLTAPLPNAGRKTRKASRTGAAARLPIVRAQIRLPDELNEKMPSAPNTPVNVRKDHVPATASKLLESKILEVGGHGKMEAVSAKKKVPKSVASMVRR